MNRRVGRWASGMALGVLAVVGMTGARAQGTGDRIWLEPVASESFDRASLRVETAQGDDPNVPVTFSCVLTSEYAVDDPLLEVTIKDASGNEVNKQSVRTFVDKTQRTLSLSWDPANIPGGTYRVKFVLMRRPKFVMLWREFSLRKTSADAVRGAWESVRAGIAPAKANPTVAASPYRALRLVIAADYLDRVPGLLQLGNVQQADSIVRYAADVLKDGETACAPELAEAAGVPEGAVEGRDGGLFVNGRPVFLGGVRFTAIPDPTDLARLKQFGMTLASFTVAPKDTLASPEQNTDFAQKLSPVFDAATKEGVRVAVSLSPQSLPEWFLEREPKLKDNGLGDADFLAPAARELTKRHLKTVMPFLAGQKAVAAVSLLDAPRFKFTGEPIRQAFIKAVESDYKSLHALSLAWKAHFDKLDEAAIGWENANTRYQNSPAYRHDWQNFQQKLGMEYVDALRAVAKETAPALPLTVASADTAFESGESAYGVDREKLEGLLDFSACCAANTSLDPFYGMGYPQQALTYTLLRSFAPEKPLLNLSDGALAADLAENDHPRAYIRALVWEGALAGLNGSTLTNGLSKLTPETLDGYASGCMDLNRLAPIVHAFQQAPAEIGILWSMPSKILTDGTVHLTSARFAFEGSSFAGYKVRFVSEEQVQEGVLDSLRVLVLADTPAVANATFPILRDYVQSSANVVRSSTPVTYDERGQSRRDVVSSARRTVLVRGQNLPTEYLHALDSVAMQGGLPDIPRAINESNYPIEGVKSRYVEFGGERYLYLVSLRKAPITCSVRGSVKEGRDLIGGRDVKFPMKLEPLDPMLIRLNKQS